MEKSHFLKKWIKKDNNENRFSKFSDGNCQKYSKMPSQFLLR